MAAPTTPVPTLDHLSWQPLGEYQMATDGTCFYMRETTGSMIAGAVFGVVIGGGMGVCGVWALLTDKTVAGRVFAAVMFLVAALFASILWYSARRGRWMIVYDRGGPGVPGEIRYNGKCLPVERVRCLSTRSSGGSSSMPERTVVAELHDGTVEVLGPGGVLTWGAHYGQQAAAWMGLHFRHSNK